MNKGRETTCIGVVTTSEHQERIKEWLGAVADSSAWMVDEPNPDIEGVLRSLTRQVADAAVIDDDALPYKNISQRDLLNFATRSRSGMKIVFLASPSRSSDDAFLHELADAGITRIVALGAFVGNPHGAKATFDAMLNGEPPTVEEARAAIAAVPKKGLFKGKKPIGDILCGGASEEEREEHHEPLISEYEFFTQEHKDMPLGTCTPEQGESPSAYVPLAGPPERIEELRARVGGRSQSSMNPKTDATQNREPAKANTPPPPETSQQSNVRRQTTIAIAGVSKGVGTTHLTLSVSLAIAQIRPTKRVACLMTDKSEYDAMTAGAAFKNARSSHPTYRGVDYLYMGDFHGIPEGYDFIVSDCGVAAVGSPTRAMTSFATASRKYMVAGGAPWDIGDAVKLLEGIEPQEHKDWTWCLFGAAIPYEVALGKLVSESGIEPKFFHIPYDNNYLESSRKAADGYRELFGTKKKSSGISANGTASKDGREEQK